MTKGKIGLNAGAVLNIIAENNSDISFSILKERTMLPDEDLWSAIGWLARENKIEIKKGTNSYPDFATGANFYY